MLRHQSGNPSGDVSAASDPIPLDERQVLQVAGGGTLIASAGNLRALSAQAVGLVAEFRPGVPTINGGRVVPREIAEFQLF